MNLIGKTLLATVTTATLALAATAPAAAQGYPRHDPQPAMQAVPNDGPGNPRFRQEHDGGDRRDDQRLAVEQCKRAAVDGAARIGNARVAAIRDVEPRHDGLRVSGDIVASHRGEHRFRPDHGTFSCAVQHGRVVHIEYRGLRGL